MGVFQEHFLRRHLVLEDFPICVETGTNLGWSTETITKIFPEVYTIEIVPALHERAQRTFNCTCILGDSATELPNVISRLDRPTVFFLDAHWSGDSTTDWSASSFSGYGVDTGMGDEQVPLLREIEAIVLFPHRCAVYIDDMDKFDESGAGLKDKGFKGEDWSKVHLKDIMEKLKPRMERLWVEEQQMLVLLGEIQV